MSHPWVLQDAIAREVNPLKNQIETKANSYDLDKTDNNVARLEYSLGTARAEIDELRARLQTLEETLIAKIS